MEVKHLLKNVHQGIDFHNRSKNVSHEFELQNILLIIN